MFSSSSIYDASIGQFCWTSPTLHCDVWCVTSVVAAFVSFLLLTQAASTSIHFSLLGMMNQTAARSFPFAVDNKHLTDPQQVRNITLSPLAMYRVTIKTAHAQPVNSGNYSSRLRRGACESPHYCNLAFSPTLHTCSFFSLFFVYYPFLQENLDSLFAIILEKIASIGDLDNTLVILASDHGEM